MNIDESRSRHWDTTPLDAFSSDFNKTIQILRLRLRYGTPNTLSVNRRFVIHVDLVDEMAQVPNDNIVNPFYQQATPQLFIYDEKSSTNVVLTIDKTVLKRKTEWQLHGILKLSENTKLGPDDHIRFHLLMKVVEHEKLTPSHQRMQEFCVASQWMTQTCLVLSTLSSSIHLSDNVTAPTTSSRCQRIFAIPTSNSSDHQLLFIEENYGHAMGSHIWDASIWLSLSFLLSPIPPSSRHTMLELGAGCGLFATVYAFISRSNIYLTERDESSLDVLISNINHNHVIADASTLLWGQSTALQWHQHHNTIPIHTVFAADVLYYWNAHEALLATLDELLQQNRSTPVYIVHKHRGRTTSQRIQQVLVHGVDDDCENVKNGGCRWQQWHVQCLGKWSDINVLQLIHRHETLSINDESVLDTVHANS